MSGEVVGTMSVYEAKVGADEYHFSGAIPPGKYALVLATDYAALQAKLDAVTKDAEALRADILEIYEQIPNLPITPETMDAATDVLTKFCIDFNATITGSDHE